MNKKEVNIPNTLTVLRLIACPVIVYLILSSKNIAALILFIAALITDLADGYIARKYKMETIFGKIVDPFADKILYACVLFPALIINNLQAWIWFFAALTLILIIGYKFFVKKELSVTNIGRMFIVVESILLMIMIYGIVNKIVLSLFAAMIIIPAVYYSKKYFDVGKKRTKR